MEESINAYHCSGCSELREGYRKAMGVRFKLDTEDAQPVEIRPGQGILIRMENSSLGVALVKAVRQVISLHGATSSRGHDPSVTHADAACAWRPP